MKKISLLILMTFLGIICYSQITYENGYIVNNNDQKINCLIKNIDWKNNPIEITYKLSDDSEQVNIKINDIKEFVIFNVSKYQRFIVNIDRSSEKPENLSYNKEPDFHQEELLLKVLIEGKANLYQYEDGDLLRFFYKTDSSNIEQLVFKSYVTNIKGVGKKIAQNNSYKVQLWNNLSCSPFTMLDLEKIKYTKISLVNFFVKFNKCNNSEYISFEENQKRDLFNLNIRPGLNYSSLTIKNGISSNIEDNFSFDNELGFRFGIELEFIMSFNRNKWAFFIEPTYQYFKSEKEFQTINGLKVVKINYNSLELPVGFRHYFFLNKNSKIFINGSIIFDIDFNSLISYNAKYSNYDLEIDSERNYSLGLGYKFLDKYSVEFRYQTRRDILSNHVFYYSWYNTNSLIFAYTLF